MWGEVAPGGEVNESLVGEENELLIGEVKGEEGDENYWVDLVKNSPHLRRRCRRQPPHHTPLKEETLGLLHSKDLVEGLHPKHTFLKEETLGFLHRDDVVKGLHPNHTFLNEETLGLLHKRDLVEGLHPMTSLVLVWGKCVETLWLVFSVFTHYQKPKGVTLNGTHVQKLKTYKINLQHKL